MPVLPQAAAVRKGQRALPPGKRAALILAVLVWVLSAAFAPIAEAAPAAAKQRESTMPVVASQTRSWTPEASIAPRAAAPAAKQQPAAAKAPSAGSSLPAASAAAVTKAARPASAPVAGKSTPNSITVTSLSVDIPPSAVPRAPVPAAAKKTLRNFSKQAFAQAGEPSIAGTRQGGAGALYVRLRRRRG